MPKNRFVDTLSTAFTVCLRGFFVFVFLFVVCKIEGCRKKSYERVVGHEISWWDYTVISSK